MSFGCGWINIKRTISVFVTLSIFVTLLMLFPANLSIAQAGTLAEPSTICLTDTGWSKPVGTWDPATKTGTLTQDVTETIQIDSNNITLDGNGHMVTGSGTGNGVYLCGRSGVTVKNLTVKSFYSGIYLYSSNNNNITNNTASSNSRYGILITSSSGNTMTGNITNSNSLYGIYLYLSNSNTITGNTANSNNYNFGITLYSSRNNTISGNTTNSNGYGICLISSSNNNNIAGNTANLNSSGIALASSSSNNNITGNTTSSNLWCGIYLFNPGNNNNNITNNTANSNSRGISLNDSSNSNTVSGNTASSNSCYGICLTSSNTANITSSSNNITGNTTNSNGNSGIYLVSSSSNNITDNTASLNSYGIFLYSSSGNTISGNTASSNRNYGIYLNSSNNNTITGNTASLNSSASSNSYGIILYSSSSNTITGNTANSNSYGIYLYGCSSSNNITGNIASSNVYGIYLNSSSSNNTIYNNNFINNGTQAVVSGGSGNIFSMAKPVGGNYWSNWTSPDSNNDGFVDNPYVFTGGQDNLPWKRQNGWLDNIAPTTTISLSGTLGNNGWYVSDIQVTLTAQDNPGGSGVAKTEYSLDGGNIWIPYIGPFPLSGEGIIPVLARSTDNAGNVEDPPFSTILKIDKTPPEASMEFDPKTKVLRVKGIDNLSEVKTDYREVFGHDNEDQSWTRRIYTISDDAGNILVMTIRLKKEGHEIKAKVLDLSYNTGNLQVLSNNSFEVEWSEQKDESIKELEQRVKAQDQFDVRAKYQESKDITGIEIKNGDEEKAIVQPGLILLRLKTANGSLTFEY